MQSVRATVVALLSLALVNAGNALWMPSAKVERQQAAFAQAAKSLAPAADRDRSEVRSKPDGIDRSAQALQATAGKQPAAARQERGPAAHAYGSPVYPARHTAGRSPPLFVVL